MALRKNRRYNYPSQNPRLIDCKAIIHEVINFAGLQYGAILLNTHPQIAPSISNHSDFRTNPMKRVRLSTLYMYTIFFGTCKDRERMLRLVNRLHIRVKGSSYEARDIKLQLYACACFFVTLLTMQETFFGALTVEARENLYQDASRFGTALQMPREMWPENLQSFWEYWDRECLALEATPDVKRLVDDILCLKNLPFLLQILMPLVRAFTIQVLPGRFRVIHGLQATWFTFLVYSVALVFSRLVYPLFPAFVRHAHITYIERECRKQFK